MIFQKLSLIITSFLIFSISTTGFAFANESSGTPAPVTNSQKICGLELCSKQMTIEEKIQVYLQSLQEKYSSESIVFQQGAGAVMIASSPFVNDNLVIAAPTISAKTLPSEMPEIYREPVATELQNQEVEETITTRDRLGAVKSMVLNFYMMVD